MHQIERHSICTIIRHVHVTEKEIAMLWTLFVILLILWALGFSLHVAGGLIHALLVIAAVLLVFQLVSGRTVSGPPRP